MKLSDKLLPSIGSINLLNSNRMTNCVTLSDTGDLMACGMTDSIVKVFWLNEESLQRSLGLNDCNPFMKQDVNALLSVPYVSTSNIGLKM